MSRLHVAVDAVIPATAARIYAVLADYRHEHPQILPKAFFSRVEVEAGGSGAGTLVRVYGRSFGRERMLRMRVEEPEPGRVLTESDVDSSLVTTFTVTPLAGDQAAQVTIATVWEPAGGVAGVFERLLMPPLMRYAYRQELRQLTAYLKTRGESG